VAGIGEVALGDQQAIRHGDLAQGFGVVIDLRQPVRRIDHGEHAVAHETRRHEAFFHQRVDDRHRIGQAGCFDHHPGDRRNLALRTSEVKLLQCRDQVALHAAAETAGIEQDHGVVELLDQMMVDADFAELVDQQRGAGHRRVFHQLVQQRRLAGTEEAGQQTHRNPVHGRSAGAGGRGGV
jgi:hypothetical protein